MTLIHSPNAVYTTLLSPFPDVVSAYSSLALSSWTDWVRFLSERQNF